MIWNFPIEPYEERYTEQWYRWFEQSFQDLDINYCTITGDSLTNKVETGSVLDVYGTHYYKFCQLQLLMASFRAGEVKDGDILFFHDLWFAGIESLAYIRNITGIKFKIWGVLHAGTWDEHDFTYQSGMRDWGKHIEKGWLKIFDKVFLGSEYHKKLICSKNHNIQNLDSKLVVTGLPFDYQEVQRLQKKENIVVFPHRLNPEKRPDLFDQLTTVLQPKFPNWQFIKSKDICQTKEEYFQLLGKSKIAISYAEQETFGYAMLEAVANQCLPVVPNKLSYQEMAVYEKQFKNFEESVSFVSNLIEKDSPAKHNKNLENFLPKTIIGKWFKGVGKNDSSVQDPA